MQNKPNPKNHKTTLTPYRKNNYKDYPLPGTQKNKPKTNPIHNKPSAPRCPLPIPQSKPPSYPELASGSAFRNLAFGISNLEFSLLPLSPKSAQISLAAPKSGAKTSKNHNPFAQNKPKPNQIQSPLSPNPPPVPNSQYAIPPTPRAAPSNIEDPDIHRESIINYQ